MATSLAARLHFGRLRISGRLVAGFAVVCAILALSGGVTLWQVATVSQSTDRMVDVRTPAEIGRASCRERV